MNLGFTIVIILLNLSVYLTKCGGGGLGAELLCNQSSPSVCHPDFYKLYTKDVKINSACQTRVFTVTVYTMKKKNENVFSNRAISNFTVYRLFIYLFTVYRGKW